MRLLLPKRPSPANLRPLKRPPQDLELYQLQTTLLLNATKLADAYADGVPPLPPDALAAALHARGVANLEAPLHALAARLHTDTLSRRVIVNFMRHGASHIRRQPPANGNVRVERAYLGATAVRMRAGDNSGELHAPASQSAKGAANEPSASSVLATTLPVDAATAVAASTGNPSASSESATPSRLRSSRPRRNPTGSSSHVRSSLPARSGSPSRSPVRPPPTGHSGESGKRRPAARESVCIVRALVQCGGYVEVRLRVVTRRIKKPLTETPPWYSAPRRSPPGPGAYLAPSASTSFGRQSESSHRSGREVSFGSVSGPPPVEWSPPPPRPTLRLSRSLGSRSSVDALLDTLARNPGVVLNHLLSLDKHRSGELCREAFCDGLQELFGDGTKVTHEATALFSAWCSYETETIRLGVLGRLLRNGGDPRDVQSRADVIRAAEVEAAAPKRSAEVRLWEGLAARQRHLGELLADWEDGNRIITDHDFCRLCSLAGVKLGWAELKDAFAGWDSLSRGFLEVARLRRVLTSGGLELHQRPAPSAPNGLSLAGTLLARKSRKSRTFLRRKASTKKVREDVVVVANTCELRNEVNRQLQGTLEDVANELSLQYEVSKRQAALEAMWNDRKRINT